MESSKGPGTHTDPGWSLRAAGFVLILGVLFGLLTFGVTSAGWVGAIDAHVERWIVAHRTGWATAFLRGFTWLGSGAVLWPLVGVAAVYLVLREHKWRAAIGVAVGLGGSVLFTNVVKALTDRSRPPASHWLVNATGSAYPSGHAMDCLAVFGALALLLAARRFPGRHVAIPASALIRRSVRRSRPHLRVPRRPPAGRAGRRGGPRSGRELPPRACLHPRRPGHPRAPPAGSPPSPYRRRRRPPRRCCGRRARGWRPGPPAEARSPRQTPGR